MTHWTKRPWSAVVPVPKGRLSRRRVIYSAKFTFAKLNAFPSRVGPSRFGPSRFGRGHGNEKRLPLPADAEQHRLVQLAGFRPLLLDVRRLCHIPVVGRDDHIAGLNAVFGARLFGATSWTNTPVVSGWSPSCWRASSGIGLSDNPRRVSAVSDFGTALVCCSSSLRRPMVRAISCWLPPRFRVSVVLFPAFGSQPRASDHGRSGCPCR